MAMLILPHSAIKTLVNYFPKTVTMNIFNFIIKSSFKVSLMSIDNFIPS